MLSPLGDPAAIETFAAAVDRRAVEVGGIGRRLEQRAGSAAWSCQRADRFRAEMHGKRLELERSAREMHAIAQDLRGSATAIRHDLHELSVLEGKVRALFQGVYDAATHPPWMGTRWGLHNLPAPGDPTWRAVASALGVH